MSWTSQSGYLSDRVQPDSYAETSSFVAKYYEQFINEDDTFFLNRASQLNSILTKSQCYYYRHKHIYMDSWQRYEAGAISVYLPFLVDDDIVRPFFFLNVGTPPSPYLYLYIGVNSTSNWSMSNVYGNINAEHINDINIGQLITYNSAGTPRFDETCQWYTAYHTIDTVYYNERQQDYRILNTSLTDFTFYSWNYLTDEQRAEAFTSEEVGQETNIPVFTSLDAVRQWVLNGDRSGEVAPRVETSTQSTFKLFIDGTYKPTYKIEVHSDFQEDLVTERSYYELRCGNVLQPFADTSLFARVMYTQASRFTWSDIERLLPTLFGQTVFTGAIKLWAQVIFDSENDIKSGVTCVELHQGNNLPFISTSFEDMFDDITAGEDGTIFAVYNPNEDEETREDYDTDDNNDEYTNEENNGTNEDSDSNEGTDREEDTRHLDVANTLTTVYKMTETELRQLGQFLWSQNFIDGLLSANANPIENVLSCKAIVGTIETSGRGTITLGNVNSGIEADKCLQYAILDIGSFYYGGRNYDYNSFLDYAPFTSLSIYLPFYGIAELDATSLYRRTVYVRYIIDVVTGTAKIKLYTKKNGVDAYLYEFSCNVGVDIPLSANNRAQVEGGLISSCIGLGISAVSANPVGAVGSLLSMGQSSFHSSTVGRSGAVTSINDNRTCRVIVTKPIFNMPSMFARGHGLMCQKSKQLGNLSGFTKLAQGVTLNFACLEEEYTELIDILTSGFYM